MYKITIEDNVSENKEFTTEGYIIAAIQQDGMHKGIHLMINCDDPDIANRFMLNFYFNFTNIMKAHFSSAPEFWDVFNKTFLMLENLNTLTQPSSLERMN